MKLFIYKIELGIIDSYRIDGYRRHREWWGGGGGGAVAAKVTANTCMGGNSTLNPACGIGF